MGQKRSPGAAESIEPAPSQPLVRIRDLRVHFPNRGRAMFDSSHRFVKAVDGISLEIGRREVFGLVGESGSGKTTAGRAVLGLVPVTSGSVVFDGAEVTAWRGGALKEIRRRMQVIFQDPFASLHPRYRIGRVLSEPLEIHGIGDRESRQRRVRELLGLVGLEPSAVDHYPHQFSGGQCQRIAIARALALGPDLVVADEPVSALDVSVQAQILNLLKRLQREQRLAMLFISHDLAVVRHICNRVAVMYLGRLVEVAPTGDLFDRPSHPYTVALMSAVLRPGGGQKARRGRRIVLQGDLPSPTDPPAGCRFHTRCWLRERLGDPPECVDADPALREVAPGHLTACHFHERMPTPHRPKP